MEIAVQLAGANEQHVGHEEQRVHALRAELVARIGRAIGEDGVVEPLSGVHLGRSSVPLDRVLNVMEPSLCVIAQGSKEVLLGDSRYQYDASNYLVATLELPRISRVLEASRERPYLSIRLELAPILVSSLMVEVGLPDLSRPADERAIAVSALDVNLLDAVVRLVRLLDAPAEAPVLMPLIEREITYRLIMGEQGARLRHLVVMGGSTSTIARAVERLRRDFDQPLRVEQIAQELG